MPRKLYILSSIAIGFAVLAIIPFSIFRTVKVKVISDKPCPEEKQAEDLIRNKGNSIWLINTDKLAGEIAGSSSCISTVKISRKFPNTLEISYTGKIPIAKIEGSEMFITIDGQLIKSQPDENIPTIFLPQGTKVETDKISDNKILFSLQIINLLLKSDFAPANVRFVNGDVTIYNLQEAVAIFSAEKSPQSQVDTLQQVLSKAKIESKKIIKIDLRFENPIVVFK